MNKLFLIDAYALIYRSYYAMMNRPMRNAEGLNTSAIFGFVKFLREVIRREHPHYLGVAFDSKGPTFRHEMYPAYKANRQAAPEDIHASVPWIKDVLHAMHIPVLEMCGWEADDIIGTMSRHACEQGFETYMVTPDKDFGQLVNHCTHMYRQKTNGEGIEILGEKEICEKYGIREPGLLVDILALWGDASDNIPGVPGVGEKTAAKLVAEWGTVEDILARADEIPGKAGENIRANSEQLLLSKRLAKIDTEAPVAFEPEKLELDGADKEALAEVFRKLDFTSFLREMGVPGHTGGTGGSGVAPTATAPRAPMPQTAPAPPADLFSQTLKSIDDTPHNYRTADRLEITAKEVAIAADERGVAFAIGEGEAVEVPWSAAAKILADETVAKVGHNLKADVMLASRHGIEVRGYLKDAMLLHYLLDPESRHGLAELARAYLDYDPAPVLSTQERADLALKIVRRLPSQGELYDRIEEPLIRVLADMELTGVRIDVDILKKSAGEMTAQAVALEDKIREMAGDPTLNVNSPMQLGEALFGRMKIDPKPRLTKTKKYRTDEEYLQSLAAKNPIIDAILEYRGLRKLLSTYIDALPALIDPATGRVHTSFNQAVTSTGRLSSSNPNLQNIPIRTAEGREIRRAFVPADNDHLLLSADYSQVELRLMAHLSGDKNLLDAFANGEDVHTATASHIFGVPLSEVTKDQRRKAKTANFGIIYGISAFGLSERLGIPRDEAREIIEGYFRSYPGVRAYMERVVEQARRDGYVSTLFGRRRMLPDLRSANAAVRALAERNAVNAPIQGSAADIMKLAMIRTWERLRGMRSRLILQVHDELVIDMYKPEQQQVTALVTDAMEHAARLTVALPIEIGIGNNWLDAH